VAAGQLPVGKNVLYLFSVPRLSAEEADDIPEIELAWK